MSTYLIPNAKPHITVEDWFKNFHRYQKNYDEVTEKAIAVQKESHELRDLSSIETQWNLNFTNELLAERIQEINYWKDNILQAIRNTENELQRLTREKELNSKDIENLYPRFTIINECHTLRNSKKRGDLCQDDVVVHLNQEYQLLENMKANLADKCEEACQQILRLKMLLDRLYLDFELKNEASEIEKETLELHSIPSKLGHQSNLNREINYSSYNSWLENCKELKSKVKEELEASSKLRKEMCIPRENARNLLSAQFEATNFALRKRIYETRYVLDELQWEKRNLDVKKEHVMTEIHKLEETQNAENEALKLIESQNRNRVYRTDSELCQDKCTDNLNIQVYNLKSIIQKLDEQLVKSRKTFDELEEQIDAIEKEVKKKTWALTLDCRCLEVRKESNS